jgi:DNA polymerase III delta prime subunit
MDAAEVKDRLKSVINNLIKDQPEEASKDLHDVLAAKMRDRINPEAAAEAESADVGDEGEAEVTDNDEGGESGGADE